MSELTKRPVAFRVKDYGDGWILYHDEATAQLESERRGAVIQGLYVRDGEPAPKSPATEGVSEEAAIAARAAFFGYSHVGDLLKAWGDIKEHDKNAWRKVVAAVAPLIAEQARAPLERGLEVMNATLTDAENTEHKLRVKIFRLSTQLTAAHILLHRAESFVRDSEDEDPEARAEAISLANAIRALAAMSARP